MSATNGTGSKDQIDQARENFRATLRKLNAQKTERLDEDSKLYKLRAKLTEIADAG